MKINNRYIGDKFEPLVIAEIGINHNGNLNTALKMVDAAKRAGIEIIKHQTHIVDDEMSNDAKKIKPGNSEDSIYNIMKSCSLSEREEIELKNYVEKNGMIFISTPFSRAAVDRLEKMNVPAYKIGSGEMNNHPLVEYIASKGKPMIISTGMNSLEDVFETEKLIKRYNIEYAFLHTTNLYPTEYKDVRLGAMVELIKNFPGIPIGLSDHTVSNLACLSAIALGASIVERHFTDNMNRNGPDIICSMDEKNAKLLVNDSKKIFSMRGGKKLPLNKEKVTINFAFSSVVSIKNIKKGDKFSLNNIWVKRPGTGEIKAKYFNDIIGKKSLNNISSDSQIKWNDVQ